MAGVTIQTIMTSKYTINISRIVAAVALALVAMLMSVNVKAFQAGFYAETSVLSQDKWVKISVEQSGMHFISANTLREWGFADPSKVRVYGYGGARIPDHLTKASFIDDVPQVQSKWTASGLHFYATGPITWGTILTNKFVHEQNPYSSYGYYFLSDREAEEREIAISGTAQASDDCADTFQERLFHELELVSPGETGHLLVGEDFKYTPNQSFTFELPGKVGNQMWMQCSFFTRTLSSASYLNFTANGQTLPLSGNNYVPTTSNASYYHGTSALFRSTFDLEGTKLQLGINFSCPATVHAANLNYIVLNYTRKSAMTNGYLHMTVLGRSMRVYGTTSSTNVWDVTDAMNITQMNTLDEGGSLVWTNDVDGQRTYAVWQEGGQFHSPKLVGKVMNQNIHGEKTPDMVIFTIGRWADQAQRIAQLHENSEDSLRVLVVDQEAVFNEFSSGTPDASAFRHLLKMFYDRGKTDGHRLKYALMFGRATFDCRHLTATMRQLGYPTMPSWMTLDGNNDNSSFQTDDFFAFLKDNSGSNVASGSDQMSIAIGRMPVRSVEEAKNAVDKLYKYVNNSANDEWKNQILLVADDSDNGVHMTQTSSMYDNFMASAGGEDYFYNKIYIDAFQLINRRYPDAHNLMMQHLEAGTLWWNYIGHGNPTSWSHEMLLSWEDMNNLYYKKFPVVYAATCEFMRWDASAISGAEVMFHNPYGGAIAVISANRPVYIANNGLLSNNIANVALTRDETGKHLPLGVILQKAKNAMAQSDDNKMRYALMGDPAMRLATPSPRVVLDAIDGQEVNIDAQPTIMARQEVTLSGSILDHEGNLMSDFNGVVSATMYDAEQSVTTNGNGDQGKVVTFEQQGGKLYAGRDSVVNGQFSMHVAMPAEIAYNFRPAALNMYAVAHDGAEAVGCNRQFYVYGYDDNAAGDEEPPVIESLYLNHESFKSGDAVNESPMLIARISDNKGINLSTAGIGHQMLVTLDGSDSYTDVSQYYTPDANGEPAGVIAYPINNLVDGDHTLRLRVWDTSGNATEAYIALTVKQGLTPKIFDVYTDASPAYTEANFYVTHNRPDAIMTITLEIYDLMGRTVWSTTSTGRSDEFLSFPITWNLCDMAGRRVNRGIYLYKVSISTDGVQYESESKKIAVGSAH